MGIAKLLRARLVLTLDFEVIGNASEMRPIIRVEIYRIGLEAIRNASVHSSAGELEIELTYGQDLTLRVADNGGGIDSSVIGQDKQGHFGLPGMNERAARIGGTAHPHEFGRRGDRDQTCRTWLDYFQAQKRTRQALHSELERCRRSSRNVPSSTCEPRDAPIELHRVQATYTRVADMVSNMAVVPMVQLPVSA